MTDIRKVPAGAGAEWLLGGLALLRKAPLTLGLLGVIWGGLSTLASVGGQVWLSLVLAVLGPVLFAGVVYATREVDQGRPASPADLVQGVRDGKVPQLLAMLLPQIAALVVVMVLLVAMVGSQELVRLSELMVELQVNPDPALVESLPLGRLFGWMIAALVVGVVAGFFTFVAIPEVMFTDRGAFAAMKLSFRACLSNLGAVLVLLVLLVIAMVALSLALQLVGMVLSMAIGAMASMFVVQLLLMAILLPVMGGVAYLAWRQMIGDAPTAPVVSTAGGFEA
ncbi:BPSS1780 family membrane protein [Lysobacter sp. A289]